jgi:predicted SAM-dependent methyltransferase
MSETAMCRERLAPFCQGLGLDMGFGGSAITPEALTFDKQTPYTNVGGDRQIFRGHCRDLSFICDGVLDYVYSSHLLEDFTYGDVVNILKEWSRVLRSGGLIVTYCPDQAIYARHCRLTGQPYNQAHVEHDFSLGTFKERVLPHIGQFEVVHENPLVEVYSWELVIRKA